MAIGEPHPRQLNDKKRIAIRQVPRPGRHPGATNQDERSRQALLITRVANRMKLSVRRWHSSAQPPEWANDAYSPWTGIVGCRTTPPAQVCVSDRSGVRMPSLPFLQPEVLRALALPCGAHDITCVTAPILERHSFVRHRQRRTNNTRVAALRLRVRPRDTGWHASPPGATP